MAAAAQAAIPAPPPASAPPADPQAVFNESALRWRERYDQRTLDRTALLKSLGKAPAAKAIDRHYQDAVQFHQRQLKLYRSLVKNQKEALKDGVLTREVYERHLARLERMMNERLLYLWGSVLPSRWNAVLQTLPKASRPPGTPFEVYPSEQDYRRCQLKDHTPIYEKEKKQLRVVRPDEGLSEGSQERKP